MCPVSGDGDHFKFENARTTPPSRVLFNLVFFFLPCSARCPPRPASPRGRPGKLGVRLSIYGIWFYDKEECQRIAELMKNLAQYEQLKAHHGAVVGASPVSLSSGEGKEADILRMLSKAKDEYTKAQIISNISAVRKADGNLTTGRSGGRAQRLNVKYAAHLEVFLPEELILNLSLEH
ncbi:hypothetical protein J1605_004299 [Eschrichtius robustus]|uniref:5'-(N(7)-methylguanosine 5'-triphospho)-[mRNA] hydrolase n=1 Tax=Eschrichtius robustus TaxID=9764 RepID=A0AB34HIS7_ESCRO|nr:hypothetical protein J1605_004299 [Eschrichtius robustus]